MKARHATGRNFDRTPTWKLRFYFYLASFFAASGLASIFFWPSIWPAGLGMVVSAAGMTASYLPKASKEHTAGELSKALAGNSVKPAGYRCLDLADESPTLQAIVEVIPARTFTLTPRRHKRPGRALVLSLWTASLIAVIFAATGWLTAPFRESATWAMTTFMTIVAALLLVAALATGNAHPRRKTSVTLESDELPTYPHDPEAKVGLHACFESTGTSGRNE